MTATEVQNPLVTPSSSSSLLTQPLLSLTPASPLADTFNFVRARRSLRRTREAPRALVLPYPRHPPSSSPSYVLSSPAAAASCAGRGMARSEGGPERSLGGYAGHRQVQGAELCGRGGDRRLPP
jgi:hypothetical protein